MLRTWVPPVAILWSCLVVAGCSCENEVGACTVTSDCRTGQRCIDGRCALAIDASRDDDGGAERDSGPERDAPSSSDAPPDATCGGTGIGVTGTPPAVLIVFDRSCSMRRRVDDPLMFASGPEDPLSRWYVAREAVRSLIDRYPTRVNWGLLTYPGVLQGCGATPPVAVAPAPGVGDDVMADLMRSDVQPFTYCTPPGSPTPGMQPHETPTSEALASAATVPALTDPTRETFILLITDGGATCGATVDSLASQTSTIRDTVAPVIVVGFSSEADSGSAGPLNEAIAANGGLPRAGGPPSYYRAETATELESLLDSLVEATLPCTFTLSETPPDPSLLRVAADDVPLDMDPANGWTYDEATGSLTLHGAACDAVRSGETTRINAAYGCPVPPCTPVAETCDGLDNDCDGAVDDGCLM